MLIPISLISEVNDFMKGKAWLYLLPAIIWAVTLAILMLLPGESFPDSKLFSYDKLAHLGVFAILSGLVMFGSCRTNLFGRTKTALLVYPLMISIVYSAGLEYLQTFSPGRTSDVYDLIANIAGAIFGVLVFYIFNKNKFAIYKLML